MSEVSFTGERLHDREALFGVDLAQHRAAYRFSAARAGEGAILDLGCGTGYGTAELAAAGIAVTGLDRIRPVAESRRGSAAFVQADLEAIPLAPGCFERIVSFQVIEHLEDPTLYLEAMARVVTDGGEVLITTPNLLTSLGVNPYHVREYDADALARVLAPHFGQVEVIGVGASEKVRRYLDARRRRIQRIMLLDPLGLRRWLPRSLIEFAFARLAVLVRRGAQAEGALPDVTPDDFPIGPATPDCVDLLAVCREPRR